MIKKLHTHPKKKTLVILFLAIVVIALLVFVLMTYFKGTKTPKLTTSDKITIAQNKHDYKTAEALIREELSAKTSKTDQADLYIQLANTLDAKGDTKGAISAYMQSAEANGLTGSLAKLLAYSYMDTGDKQNAIKYLKLAISLWPKEDPLHNAEVASFNADIEYLGGTSS